MTMTHLTDSELDGLVATAAATDTVANGELPSLDGATPRGVLT